jgi:hypothetical protein
MSTRPAPTRTRTRSAARAVVALATALVVALGATTGAGAAPPRVELTGTGTWSADPWITAVRAEVSGRPFDGTFTGGLRIDGLPAPGTCIDAYMLSGLTRHDGRHEAGLLSVGELCGQHAQEGVSVVSAVFLGEFDLYEGSRRDLHDTQGFVEVRFTADGRTSVTLVG